MFWACSRVSQFEIATRVPVPPFSSALVPSKAGTLFQRGNELFGDEGLDVVGPGRINRPRVTRTYMVSPSVR